MKKFTAASLLALVGSFVMILSTWATISPGYVGVVSNFGEISEHTLPPGFHFVAPWKSVIRVDCRVQRDEEDAATPTKEGLTCQLKANLLWRLDERDAPAIIKEVGEKFESKIVTPYFRSAIRDATIEFDSESLYTADRAKVEAVITNRAKEALGKRGIILENIVLTDLILPKQVKDRIEAKVGAEQDVKRMEFVLRQKELEAKQKVVEAEGIAKAQSIIKKDLDDNYLRYLWIEALKECAIHKNAVIYIPTGNDGMPIFKKVVGEK